MSQPDDLHNIDLTQKALDATRIHFLPTSQTSTTQQNNANETETQVIQEYKEKQTVPVAQDETSRTIYVSHFALHQTPLNSGNFFLQVDFEPNDPRNPIYFPKRKKWGITLLACFSTLVACSFLALSFPVSTTKLIVSLDSFDGFRIQSWFPLYDP